MSGYPLFLFQSKHWPTLGKKLSLQKYIYLCQEEEIYHNMRK